MSNKLTIAIPSKGRLEEASAALFADAGLGITRTHMRGYRGKMVGVDNVDIIYLSASEIAKALQGGHAHFGITGEDLIRENISNPENDLIFLQKLGFGHADVVVAVPDAWADVNTMADVADVAALFRAQNKRRLRVATKYITLTQNFFARCGISDYVIVQSFGATEGAPASGAAEIIVDITSSGETLAANRLRVPEDGIMLNSQANLVAACTAPWSETAHMAAKHILTQLHARLTAKAMVQIEIMRAASNELRDALKRNKNYCLSEDENKFFIPRAEIGALTQLRNSSGQPQCIITQPEFIFTLENPLFEALMARL